MSIVFQLSIVHSWHVTEKQNTSQNNTLCILGVEMGNGERGLDLDSFLGPPWLIDQHWLSIAAYIFPSLCLSNSQNTCRFQLSMLYYYMWQNLTKHTTSRSTKKLSYYYLGLINLPFKEWFDTLFGGRRLQLK